jgi:hypothetical protein
MIEYNVQTAINLARAWDNGDFPMLYFFQVLTHFFFLLKYMITI